MNPPDAPGSEIHIASGNKIEPPLRVGIAHLMLWTAGSGVVLAVLRLHPTTAVERYLPLVNLGILLDSLIYGAALASLPVLIARRSRGQHFPITAGHTVLLLYGLVALVNCLMMIVKVLMYRARGVDTLLESDSSPYWFLRGVAAYLMAVCFFHALRQPYPVPWKAFLMLTGGVAFLHGCMFLLRSLGSYYGWMLFSYLATFVMTVKLIPLLGCLIHDTRDHVRYDVLHWAELAVAGMGLLAYLYWRVLSWVIDLAG